MSRLLLFLPLFSASVGCGEVVTFADAPGADAPEAGDAGPPLVSVRPHLQRIPAVGSTVLSHDPDGQLIARVVVDASGVARIAVSEGGSITFVPRDVITAHGLLDVPPVMTVYDVTPGDDLTLGEPAAPEPQALGSMSASFSAQAGATIHQLATACDNVLTNASPATLEFQAGCVDGSFDVLAMTRGNPARARLFENVTFSRLGDLSLPGVWPAAPTFTAFNRRIPTAVSQISVARVQFLDGHPAHVDQVFSVPTATAGTITFAAGHAPGTMRVRIAAIGPGRTQVLERQVVAALSHDVDLIAELLPSVSPPAIDVANRVVSWSEQGASAADAVAIELAWDRAGRHRWTLYAPHGALTRRLPDLPTDLAEADFGLTDVLGASSASNLIDTDTHAGWDDIRAGVSPLFEDDQGSPHLEVPVYRQSSGF